MELKIPRKKTYCKWKPISFLSLIDPNTKISGYFNGFSVLVQNTAIMKELHTKGCFGKANLSRSYPSHQNSTEIIRKRVYDRRKTWGLNNKEKKKIIVVPDSDSEDDYFNNLKSEYCIDTSSLKEVLALSLEEAYFLHAINCLSIYQQEELLNAKSAWTLFAKTDKYFSQNYVVYQYFRLKNWIVKPGIKFGGDYLLYKDGPAFYHASYLVIIDVLDQKTLQRKHNMVRRSMEATNMIALNRLCETVGKELLICQILWPEEITTPEFQDLNKITINEVVMRRWILSENRELKS